MSEDLHVPQCDRYSDKELAFGAHQNGLTIPEERQRIRLMQSDFGVWPNDLQKFLRIKPDAFCFDLMQKGVVSWLKTLRPKGIPAVVPVVEIPEDDDAA